MMYNLLVNTEWNGVYCKYQYERASISSLINETNAGSDSNKFDQIKNYPALFIHEGFEGVSKLGWITKVRDMQGEYQIEYTHECEVDSEKLKKIARDLDIAEFASHRTHWALKEIDLSKLFEKCDILPKESFDSYFHTPSFSRMHFDVAFSFPGEKRDLVEKIVEKIKAKKTYSIFYDRDFEEELAVPGMDLRLINIYKKQAKLVCIFLCPEYEQKKWCRLEWRAIREIIDERNQDNIMLLRFESLELPGLSSNDGYVDINQKPPEETANLIIKRLKRL